MSPQAVVRAFYSEAIVGRDSSACLRLLTDDFTHNGDPVTAEGQVKVVDMFLSAFDPLHHTIEIIFSEGDMVCAHQRWSGKHVGTFAGVEATGRDFEFTSTAILQVQGDRIAKAWDEMDLAGLMAQLTG